MGVVMTWLRRLLARWLSLPAPPPRLRDALLRLDVLEERVDYQTGEIKRLRGRVTGALRREPEEPAGAMPADTTPQLQSGSMTRRALIVARAQQQSHRNGPGQPAREMES